MNNQIENKNLTPLLILRQAYSSFLNNDNTQVALMAKEFIKDIDGLLELDEKHKISIAKKAFNAGCMYENYLHDKDNWKDEEIPLSETEYIKTI